MSKTGKVEIDRAVDGLLDVLQVENPEMRELIARAGVTVILPDGRFMQVRKDTPMPRVVVSSDVAPNE